MFEGFAIAVILMFASITLAVVAWIAKQVHTFASWIAATDVRLGHIEGEAAAVKADVEGVKADVFELGSRVTVLENAA